jgi:hypothetical protein
MDRAFAGVVHCSAILRPRTGSVAESRGIIGELKTLLMKPAKKSGINIRVPGGVIKKESDHSQSVLYLSNIQALIPSTVQAVDAVSFLVRPF